MSSGGERSFAENRVASRRMVSDCRPGLFQRPALNSTYISVCLSAHISLSLIFWILILGQSYNLWLPGRGPWAWVLMSAVLPAGM